MEKFDDTIQGRVIDIDGTNAVILFTGDTALFGFQIFIFFPSAACRFILCGDMSRIRFHRLRSSVDGCTVRIRPSTGAGIAVINKLPIIIQESGVEIGVVISISFTEGDDFTFGEGHENIIVFAFEIRGFFGPVKWGDGVKCPGY